MKPIHLLFVYNADADLFSAVTDFVHKIVSPATYQCSLCQLTYGNLSIKQQWKTFLDALPVGKTFLHRNQFQKQYGIFTELPAIFYLKEDNPLPLLTAAQLNSYQHLSELQETLLSQLKIISTTT